MATDAINAGHDEAELAREALDRVRSFLSHRRADAAEPVRVWVDESGGEPPLTLPRSTVELLARILVHMSAGDSVSIVPTHAELTTQQAADLLNVSRPYLIRLLDEKGIEYRLIGTHRRILASSLLDYRRRDDARRRAAADELSAMTRDMGFG